MVNKRMQTLLTQLRQQGIRDEKLLRAIEAVPRERFVDEALDHKAYENTALPIGSGQTISQPYMVARMTELLNLKPTSRVLEIGTGSGYQTAITAHLVQHVCSVERIKGLQWQAKRRLKQLDLHNVSPATATAGRAGRRVARSMRSSSPPRRRRSRRRWWNNWTTAAFWCCRWASRPKPSNAFNAMATSSLSMRWKRCACPAGERRIGLAIV